MRHITSLLKITLVLSALLLAGLPSAAQERCYQHVVRDGETLFRLSQDYGVSVANIRAKNPDIKDDVIKVGATILIPVVSHTDGMAGTRDCRFLHKVQKKETLYGISQQYGVSLTSVLNANPDFKKNGGNVKKGDVVCIPYASDETIVEIKPVVGFDNLHAAVVLPLLSSGVEGERCVEFYRGFLLAVDKLKKSGLNINVTTFNETPGSDNLAQTLEQVKQSGAQVVIGPLYPSHFATFANFMRQEKTLKWLLPFSSKFNELSTTDNIFLLNAPDELKAEYVARLYAKAFPGAKAVFLHEAGGNEAAFSASLQRAIAGQGMNVTTIAAGYSTAQLRTLLGGTQKLVFIPDVSDSRGSKAVMQKLLELKQFDKNQQVCLLTYPEWSNNGYVEKNELYAVDSYVLMNYFFNPYSGATNTFIDTYKRWFKTGLLDVYPRMAMIGYDAGMYFLSGLHTYGADFAEQDLTTEFYQSELHFKRAYTSGGYSNDCMYFIHYAPSRVINKISL